jgi:predicted lipoprotein with Yx(FWY)xxD motif
MDNQWNSKLVVKPLRMIGFLAVLAMVLAACAPALPAATAAPTLISSSSPSVSLDLATDPSLGKILVDGGGRTLYVFTKDAPDTVNCDAKCQANWPPLVSSGTPKVGPGVDSSMIGTASLPDGAKILTYDHMPLYYYFKDTQPGQVSGENVGSVWFVVSPDGKPVKPASVTAPTATPVAGTSLPTIMVATDPKLGQILADGNGMTLYAFTKDGPDQSNCTGSCLSNWPPLLTQGKPTLGPGVDGSLIGSAKLADGNLIVTYNHMPLYYFAKDTKPGDVLGQGVGGFWYVVSPDGKLVQPPSTTAATPTPAASTSEPTIMLATDAKLGQILVNGKGMTLYAYTKDGPDQSNCTGGCLTYWPPLLTQGTPILGAGIDDSKIGSALLSNGTHIVTYNHMPLYYFVKDTKPGDVTGQGVSGIWYVVSQDGEMLGR